MIDQNRDGFIDKEDLHDMLASLGKDPPDSYLEDMMKEAPGPINFTMFLTLFGEKLNGTDPEDVIKNAFACFDADQTGFIKEDYLRELLMTMGDRWEQFSGKLNDCCSKPVNRMITGVSVCRFLGHQL